MLHIGKHLNLLKMKKKTILEKTSIILLKTSIILLIRQNNFSFFFIYQIQINIVFDISLMVLKVSLSTRIEENMMSKRKTLINLNKRQKIIKIILMFVLSTFKIYMTNLIVIFFIIYGLYFIISLKKKKMKIKIKKFKKQMIFSLNIRLINDNYL